MKNRWLIASVGYRHPYLHRQCLRLERTDKAYYAGYGFYPERNDLDFFDRNFISRTVSGIFGRLR